MKIKRKSKGISLIVLVITVIILSILAATVIIALSNTNIINMASNAKKASDIAEMKNVAHVIYADLLLEKHNTVSKEDVISKLEEQGYIKEQIDLITIDIIDGNLVIMSKGIYGIKREVGSTSTSWERIADSVGLEANACLGTTAAVRNDFDNIAPWSGIVSYNYDTSTGKVTAMYGDDAYRTDGSNGDVLTKIPEFYYKREQKVEAGKLYEYIYISETERAGYTKSEEFSIGRYISSFNDTDTGLRSTSGARVATNKNVVQFRTLAKSTNYTMLDYRYFLLQLLYLVEYADYDSQAKLGYGNTEYRYNSADKAIVDVNDSNTITIALTDIEAYKVGQQIDIGTGSLGSRDDSTQTYRTITNIQTYSGGGQTITFDGAPIDIVAGSHRIWSCAQNTGSGDLLGMKSGYVGINGKSAVIYRGIEDFFGNALQFVDGINVKSTGEVYISYNSANYTSDKFTGDYKYVGYSAPTSGGYIKTLGYNESHPLIAIITSATSNENSLKDYYWSTTGSYSRVGFVGGHYRNGDEAGAFYWRMDTSSSSRAIHLASRLLKE